VRQTGCDLEIEKCSAIFNKMYKSRKLYSDESLVSLLFSNLNHFFKLTRQGNFYIIEKGTDILGGIIVLYSNKTMLYYRGFTDPEERSLPLLHLVFYQIIKDGIKQGYTQLDLGGYNLKAKSGSQEFEINRFKDGFGGEIINYPPCLHINIYPFGRSIYEFLFCMQRLIRALK
jgi:lipid II:glycine glycyltransferase (peptidoglycan interpeptide bridge formation enzyme)